MIPLKDNIPTRRTAWITISLIAANVVVYVLSIRHGGSLFGGPSAPTSVHYGVIPYEITHPGRHCDLVGGLTGAGATVACQGQAGVTGTPSAQPSTGETLLTSMFMHGGLLHLGGNMLFLWIFGNNVEDSMGRLRFIAFYLLGGLAALAGQVLVNPDSTAPTVGASGAIAAVLGGYLLLFPRARVITLIFIIFFVTIVELPALIVLGFWFVLQMIYGQAQLANPAGGGAGVAYFAHIGGFVLGMALIRAFVRRRGEAPGQPVY